jgi:hypothetical protein
MMDKSPREIVKYLQQCRVFPTRRNCVVCGRDMSLVDRLDTPDQCGWRCPCGKRRAIRDGTILDKKRIPLSKFLQVVHNWAIQVRQTDQADYLEIDRGLVTELQMSFRLAATRALNMAEYTLGGINRIVEIDESLFIKVKHHRGKDMNRPAVWIFGLLERPVDRQIERPRVLFIIVPSRDAFNLLNVIYKHVAPNTMIYMSESTSESTSSTSSRFFGTSTTSCRRGGTK